MNAVIEVAFTTGKTKSIRHLSGQKLEDVIEACSSLKLTPRQRTAFENAMKRWADVSAQRNYLAHGVALETIDRNGEWFAVFDLTTYKSREAIDSRWTVSQAEAADFQSELAGSFTRLSGELGHMKRRFLANPDTARAASPDSNP